MATGGSLDIYLLHSELFLSVASDFNQSIKVILLNRRCLVLPVIFILLDQKAKSRARYTFVVGCFFFFFLFTACGSSRARGQIGPASKTFAATPDL